MLKSMIAGGSTKALREFAVDAITLDTRAVDYYDDMKPYMFESLFQRGDTHQFAEAYSWLIAEISLEIDRKSDISGDVILQHVQEMFIEATAEYPTYANNYLKEHSWANKYPPFVRYIREHLPLKVKPLLQKEETPSDTKKVTH